MSEKAKPQDTQDPPTDTEVQSASESDQAPPDPSGGDPVRKWILVTFAVIFVLLAWYLAADRFTPFTSQARVDAYVIPIAPRVTGNVLSVGVVNNQRVNPGDELLRLDDAQYRLAVDRTTAELESAEQDLGASAAAVVSASAAVNAARANFIRAEKDFARMERIFAEDPGAISQRRLDAAQATLAGSRSSVAGATAELERARQQRGREGAENPRIQAARAALAQAELELEWTRVRAPGGGLVTDLQVDVGNLAQAGQPLMTFVAINDVWIQADMRENNLGHIEPGAPVEIALDAHPGRIYRGHVRSIGYGVDSGAGSALGRLPTIENDRNWLRDAQRFPVIIEIDHRGEDLPAGLRVGAQATVIVFTGRGILMTPVGKLYLRLVSLMSYAY